MNLKWTDYCQYFTGLSLPICHAASKFSAKKGSKVTIPSQPRGVPCDCIEIKMFNWAISNYCITTNLQAQCSVILFTDAEYCYICNPCKVSTVSAFLGFHWQNTDTSQFSYGAKTVGCMIKKPRQWHHIYKAWQVLDWNDFDGWRCKKTFCIL